MNSKEGLQQRRIYRPLTSTGDFRDFELVPSCLPEIVNILRVADEIEERSPRAAFLCMHIFNSLIWLWVVRFLFSEESLHPLIYPELCEILIGRIYAFERAHELDPRSKGRGVRQFKTALMQKLQKVCRHSEC